MASEPCAECGGKGLLNPEIDGVDCEWCDGTGEVPMEQLAPPALPEAFTVYVTRGGDCVEHTNVVTFEPMDTYYRFILSNGTRVVIPYSSDIYAIEVVPDE